MGNERIFIVEDERIIAIDLQRRLSRLGYSVCGSAASSEEALVGIRAQQPDLVLMDIVIEGPIDGIDVAVQIRKELNVPVLFLTAYTDAKTLERAKEACPLGYILKPFKERELASMIEMAIFKNRADNQIREKEQLFSAILKSTTDAIIAIGKKNEVLFINPEAEQILEIGDVESKNRGFEELFSLTDMESGEPFRVPRPSDSLKVVRARNLKLTNRNGNHFIVEMTVNREASAKEGIAYLISFKDISHLHEIADTLKYQSSHDTLTGLLNRNELVLRMDSTLINHGTQGTSASALFVDIDHFRIINDSCGAKAGDQLLRETAALIREAMSEGDYAARFGGDDFVIVHYSKEGRDSFAEAQALAKALVTRVGAKAFYWEGKEYPTSISAAVLPFTVAFRDAHEMIIEGTQLVANAHEAGGNHFDCYRNTEAEGRKTLPVSDWLNKIHEALTHDRFKLYYQPILPLGPGNDVKKIEILLRMVESDGSIIQPGEFIPIAERYNIMPSVDRWVIRKAFEAFARMQADGNPLAESIFCVNLSGASLLDESIIGFILEAVDACKVPANRFCIEVTESSAIHNLTSASRFIYILKERGFTFALDDFGSGFSSLNYLKNLPVEYLKIDGCFIRNMDRDKVDYNMVQAISSMSRALGLRTIGEYAENETIIGQLRDIGVDYAQGYGISKPLPLEA